MALAAIVRAGLDGIQRRRAAPPIVSGNPASMSAEQRAALDLARLPETLEQALEALLDDPIVLGWFPPALIETFLGIRSAEIEKLRGMDDAALCVLYKVLY